MALVELSHFTTAIEAEIVRAMLEDQGIAAFVLDAGMGPLVAGVRLMVDEEDRGAAERAISAADRGEAG